MKFFLKTILLVLCIISISSFKIKNRKLDRKHHKKDLWGSFKKGLSSVTSGISKAASAVGNAVSSVAEGVGNAVTKAANAVDNAVSTAASKVADAANGVVDKAKDAVNKVVKKVDVELDQGGGSWKTGFECPKILIGTNEKNLNVEGAGTFFPDQIMDPATIPEKLGWTFDMTKQPPGPNLKKILIQFEKTNIWYLPFSFISTDFEYVNPIGFKYLQATITNPDKEEYLLRVNLPYKGVGWFITDPEGKKITEFLNKKRDEKKITSPNWKIMLSWSKTKMNIDLKMALRKNGSVVIKSYKDGSTNEDYAKWGKDEQISGSIVQTTEIDTSTFTGEDSIQIYAGNYSFFTESILTSGATITIFNDKRKVASLPVPQNGDRSFPYWYVCQLFKYGLIIENKLGTKKQSLSPKKLRRNRLRLRRNK